MAKLQSIFACLITVFLLCALPEKGMAQVLVMDSVVIKDSLRAVKPVKADSIVLESAKPIKADSIVAEPVKPIKPQRDWAAWKPNAKRAMWMAIVFPGGGQIYNRKYWKLPIIYGGFVGCAYAWSWNNQMYQDYKQAYLDIMDDDDSTHSYDQFLHLGASIDDSNKERYENLFSKRKDRFRRYRDLSFFCILAVYGLSIVDAYVDASLSEFDISDDLTMRVEPTYIGTGMSNNPIRSGGLGVQCSFNF